MMKRLMEMLNEFMTAADQRMGEYPGDIYDDELDLGLSLIQEEYTELWEAVKDYRGEWKNPDKSTEECLADIADALGDLLYVTTWTAQAFGFPMEEIMEEIQRANMDKFGPGSTKREDGKQLKPPDWRPPNIKQFMERR